MSDKGNEKYMPFYDPRKISGYINKIKMHWLIDGNMFETVEDPDAIRLGFKKAIQINLVGTSQDCKLLDRLQQSKKQFRFEIYDGTIKLHTISKHAMILTPPKFVYGKGISERNYRILCPDLELAYETH